MDVQKEISEEIYYSDDYLPTSIDLAKDSNVMYLSTNSGKYIHSNASFDHHPPPNRYLLSQMQSISH